MSELEKDYWTTRLYALRKNHAEVVDAEKNHTQLEITSLAEQITELTAMFQCTLIGASFH